MDHILHLDELFARDAKHHIQLGYPVLNYPRYIPTTVELCRSSFNDIIDKLKADLAYFKDDFRNEEMFKAHTQTHGEHTLPWTRPWSQHPRLLGHIYGRPWINYTQRKPPSKKYSSAIPQDHCSPTTYEHPQFPPPRNTPLSSLRSTPVPPSWPVPPPRRTQPQPTGQSSTSSTTPSSNGSQPQPQPTPVPNPDNRQTRQTPLPNLPPSGSTVPNNRWSLSMGHTKGVGTGLPNNTGTPPMCLRCGKNNHSKSYCREHKVFCKHCKS